MSFENVNLWFAKNNDGKIITINEVNEDNKHNKYYCPLCNSEVVARQGEINSWCFAHIDKSKCDGESMIHWWFKNKFLIKGDKFIIKSDVEKEYICKKVLVEQSYIVNNKEYKPDITIITETGEIVYFEMKNTNKKKVEEYLDIWMELNNVVVEVDIKTLINSEINKFIIFKALYYKSKCFNIEKNNTYYNTIGKYKEKLHENGEYEQRKKEVEKLDWLWRDVIRYKQSEVDIEYMINLIDSIENEKDREIVKEILCKPRCNDLYYNYKKYKTTDIYNEIVVLAKQYLNESYNKYIRCDGYESISILDVSDNCYFIYYIDRYDKKEILDSFKKHILEILNYEDKKEKERQWNKIKKNIENDLLQCEEISTYIREFNETHDKYNINFNVGRYMFNDNCESNDGHNFIIELKYNCVIAERYEIEIKEENYILGLYDFLLKSINNYFTNLKPISKDTLKDLDTIILNLQNRYSKTRHNIKIQGELWLENIYNISCENDVARTFYLDEKYSISNLGILEKYSRYKIMYSSQDMVEIENYIVNDISNKIRNRIYKGV